MATVIKKIGDSAPLLKDLIISINELPEGSQKEKLFAELYHRLKKKFFKRCTQVVYKLLKNAPDWKDIRDDIFQETFIIAVSELQHFTVKDDWQDAECEKVILFWLGKIANNKVLQHIRTSIKEQASRDEYERYVVSENSDGETGSRKYTPTYDPDALKKTLAGFNPMTTEIMLACLDNDTVKENNTAHLPDEIIATLVAKYGVTSAAIRKAKERAIKALKLCKIEQ